MSRSKRSHATYEADLHDEAAVHVAFGTPLPPLGPEVRDDGAYIPVHKQEVRDEHGRRRLHGAFTGGWSAGYFNTVGSKEGWTPSTFVSSRTNRQKNEPRTSRQRPEDYMDEEDLADTAATQNIQTTDPFSSLGASSHNRRHASDFTGLARVSGDTMGLKLLRKMGWKDGQGIGPKVRRTARLGVMTSTQDVASGNTHLFAPDDVNMIEFDRKRNRQGLGFIGEQKLSQLSGPGIIRASRDQIGMDEEASSGNELPDGLQPALGISRTTGKPIPAAPRGGLGVGILNDTGSDDEDPYDIGPRISYNRVLGGDKSRKKKKQPASLSANPTVRSKPVFIAKSSSTNAYGQTRCLDGKLSLKGFALGRSAESRLTGEPAVSYRPPTVPDHWKSTKRPVGGNTIAAYISAADAAKTAQHDPRSRALLLGESTLPGKSIFDYMSSAARERLAAATGRTNLPPAKGEIPAGHARTAEQKLQDRLGNIPVLAKETAIAAMSRGSGTGGPYANNEAKQARYRLYLQDAAGFGGSAPLKPSGMTEDDYVKEIEEFYGCARLFKPMTGFMATRFTTASTGSREGADAGSPHNAQQVPGPIGQADPIETAAKMGMYGRMTRLTADFFPTRLLCKRFNVRPPAHSRPDSDAATPLEHHKTSCGVPASEVTPHESLSRETNSDVDYMLGFDMAKQLSPQTADISKLGSEAGEVSRPSNDIFKSIFGDSSDEAE
ncbi:hypothetical protein HER10_EVM0000143 [Colletotrichum scovillei]|uniref:uncharacterized protein n=1 Tax=Colletotrichum scovillei TaxID=1209932 RepID=UPI0015C312C9|nr:uncharacterized protein HER10_EVM0000143 [Colletotrichum scovillei]KAF4780630.1 hypothetical protein HER10_EVM0000143 [Colletotrichum scovillei]KAG7052633.1 hypothetical protein JMJ78_0005649 [Colletotrichum scovillei]